MWITVVLWIILQSYDYMTLSIMYPIFSYTVSEVIFSVEVEDGMQVQ